MISAIISTYNREKYLPKLFNSISNQEYEDVEILVVDNNSPGNTKELTHSFQKANKQLNIHYYLETQQGLSFGRNRGIKEAKGDIIIFLDDDAFLSKTYFKTIAHCFNNYPDAMAIGSKILLEYESTIPKWENPYLNSLLGYFNLGENSKYFSKKKYPRGSNMCFRSKVFKQIGMFNTELGRIGNELGGGEEKDLFFRMYQQGLKALYIPDAIIYHTVPKERTTYQFIRKQALGTGESEYLRIKNKGPKALFSKLIIELLKWKASTALCLFYLITARPQKGIMIIRFRYWVNKGLLTKKKR